MMVFQIVGLLAITYAIFLVGAHTVASVRMPCSRPLPGDRFAWDRCEHGSCSWCDYMAELDSEIDKPHEGFYR
jgi:hypothetical protein